MKLFGYSISLNILILIGILYLIMVVNALSSSCNREGLSTAESVPGKEMAELFNTATKEAKKRTLTSENRTYYSDQIKTKALGLKSQTNRDIYIAKAEYILTLPIV